MNVYVVDTPSRVRYVILDESAQLAAEVIAKHRGYDFAVETLMVGRLGSYDPGMQGAAIDGRIIAIDNQHEIGALPTG